MVALNLICLSLVTSQLASPAPDLAGRWVARLRGGPDVQGVLRIHDGGQTWLGEIAGRKVSIPKDGATVRFELPEDAGAFRGAFDKDRRSIVGHWIQPGGNVTGYRMASPLALEKRGSEWVGETHVLQDLFTMYLVVTKADDGALKAYFRNPERNLGSLLRADHLEVDGNKVKLIGSWGGSKKTQTLQSGEFDEENQVLHLYDPNGGITFDYHRVSDDEPFDTFYPRGAKAPPYKYSVPENKDDGWAVASAESVGFSRPAIETFGQMLTDLRETSYHETRVHGFLLARHGKLAVEEYFHGYSSDIPHDTRSASKSMLSVLTGMAMYKDPTFTVSSSAFQIMGRTDDPAKNAITMDNLLTMSSGLDADDSNDESPGNEDHIAQQKENKDWYDYTMKLAVVAKPGEKAVYASAQPNLVGGVVAKKTGKWLPDFFRDSFAKPLGIKHYFMPIMPLGEGYMGGGMQWYPRDFMKMGQLMLQDGVWNGKRLLSSEYVKKAVDPRYQMGSAKYGYYWYVFDYPYAGKTIRCFYAGGNGGQIVMVFPQYDVVLCAFGGNYADSTTFTMQREYVPKYVLPMFADAPQK